MRLSTRTQRILAGVGLLVVILAAWLFAGILFPFLTSDALREYVDRAGLLGPVVVILYVVASHVFAPLAGLPVLIVAVPVFGIVQAFIFFYIGSMISAAINFWISRKLGRAWVRKLAGEKTMAKIDQLVSRAGEGILWVGRVFASAFFEEISYAAGLTKMSFRKYFLITALGSVVPHVAFGYLFRNADFARTGNALGLVGGVAFMALLSMILVTWFTKRDTKEAQPELPLEETDNITR